jgi:hypothetical protein
MSYASELPHPMAPQAPGDLDDKPDNIIELDAVGTLEITELAPHDGVTFIGKRIQRDGSIAPYPHVTWWRQTVVKIPATVPALFNYLQAARMRNICLIRGAPANPSQEKTRRRKADGDHGDRGFTDQPTQLHFFDIDGARIDWRADPGAAVKRIVASLGEPWASASYVWFFSAGHGLKMETVEVGNRKQKRWNGEISDGDMRVRLAFITDRALTWREAAALTTVVKAVSALPLDEAICRVVQPNYITRPLWAGYPGRDVLGDIPTIGWVGGGADITTVTAITGATVTATVTATVAVPDNLAHQARWAAAQGHGVVIADHPDAIAAVRGICSDGRIRQHAMAAIVHLLKANPAPDHVSAIDHSIALAKTLQAMIKQHEAGISAQLAAHGRSWADLAGYLNGMDDWARWLIERPGALNRKTVKLAHEQRAPPLAEDGKQAIFDRVANIINDHNEGVRLVIAPTGARKSTLIRAAAVKSVTDHPENTEAILVSRHELSDEMVRDLLKEHPNGRQHNGAPGFTAAVWRGRHHDDPKRPGKKMCWRDEEAKDLEAALVSVENNLCKKGRGATAVFCPFRPLCGYQEQQKIEANIWFAAHEMMAHEMPKAFGNVGRVWIDENPTDAFMFGSDITDEITLELDALLTPPQWFSYFSLASDRLMKARTALYHTLDRLRVPIDPHQGVPVTRETVHEFVDMAVPPDSANDKNSPLRNASGILRAEYNVKELIALEWRDKVEPDIRPDMSAEKVRENLETAVENARVKKLVTLWSLLGDSGRVQIHRGKQGRIIRMTGLRELAKGWDVPTLITDATGDAGLLRAIWPQLETDIEEWQQLPRPASVRVFQCVDRAISKWAVAVEGKNEKELDRKVAAARRLYAAVLAKALEYGGAADVAIITYKSTEEWIRANCFVPDWLKLLHHGAVEGTNALSNVRALFVIGRPLASPEAVTRMTEALFGDYIGEREYLTKPKGGRIPITPDAAGNNCILVDAWKHPNPRADRMRRQITEGALLQAVGRARAGLRDDDNPLDIHLWTDVPLPELGPVEPVLWAELEVGLEGLMWAAGGVWLGSAPHAAKAYPELFSENTLEQARKRAQAGGGGTSLIESIISNVPPPPLLAIQYQGAGKGQKPARAVTLLGPEETRAWLEQRLGPLAKFEVMKPPAPPPKPETWPAVLRNVPYLARTAAGQVLRWW